MLRKRIIFTLIYNDTFFTQSRNFRLQKVGNLDWLEKNYQFRKIAFSLDELIVLNASRTGRSITEFAFMISRLVQDVFIPICAGGGIRSMDDAQLLFNSGADKISVNTILWENPSLVEEIVKRYGSQSVVASVDYKTINGDTEVYIENGTKKLALTLQQYLDHIETLDIGEIYLNSIDKDGTGFGYDLATILDVCKKIKKPLIIAGGAGNEKHLEEGLGINEVSAVATANLFNFIGNGLPNARRKIIGMGLNIADWGHNNNTI
jgi:cyclase